MIIKKKTKKFSLQSIKLILILCCFINIYGCKNISKNDHTEIEKKIDFLYNEGWNISLNYPHDAIALTQAGLFLADSIQYEKGIGKGNNFLGIYYSDINNFVQAEAHFIQAMEIRSKLQNKEGVAYVYDNLCRLKKEEGDYSAAIKYGFNSLSILEELSIIHDNPTVLLNLGIAHDFNNDIIDARKYYQEGLKYAKQIADSVSIGSIHFNFGLLEEKINNDSAALFHLETALAYYKDVGHALGEASALEKIGEVFLKNGAFKQAKTMLDKSLAINLNRKDSLRLFYNYINLAQYYKKQNRFQDALKLIDESSTMLLEINRIEEREKLNREYGKLFKEMGRFDKALIYFEQAEIIEDSIINQQKNNNILKYQKEDAERVATLERSRKKIMNQRLLTIITLISLLLLALIFSLYVLNQRKIRKEQELTNYKTQQEIIIDKRIISATQQLRKSYSHNIHNHVATPLTHLKRFLEPIYRELSFDDNWQNKIAEAMQLADKICITSRDISYKLKPENIDWIERIKLSLFALETNEKISATFNVSDLTEKDFSPSQGEKILSIIGNVLSNVEKHSKADKVGVKIQKLPEELKIEIRDNGIGFDQNLPKGVGLSSIYSKVEELNGVINLHTEVEHGTSFEIKIPINNAD